MRDGPTTRVRAFYPADPAGVVPGGVDTFIRGIAKWAPDDLEFSLVGMTTDEAARPLGRWTSCDLGRRQFAFFPVLRVPRPGGRAPLPLSLRFSAGALRFRNDCRDGFDVYEFHRAEPALLYLGDSRPKNIFFHTDLAVIRSNKDTDILWRWLPGGYFAIESRVMRTVSSAWSVSQPGTDSLRSRYPAIAGRIRYTPTWVDPEVFFPLPDAGRRSQRAAVEHELGLDAAAFRIVTVGRLDTSKDPDLLLSAVAALAAAGANVELLFIGDGVLRSRLCDRVHAEGLADRVRFLGLKGQQEIARYLQAVDCFALTSAYEGMPMALLEALAAGVPVVTTQVGEISRIVKPGINGEISATRAPGDFAAHLDRVRRSPGDYPVAQCRSSIDEFTPARVLEPIYENYRQLGSR